MNRAQREKLMAMVSQPVQWQCDLARFTSFAIGGPAEAVVSIHYLHELQPLLDFFGKDKIPWRVIGKGTNLLVCDAGFPGVILRLGGEFVAVSEEVCDNGSIIVRVGAGASLARLSRRCAERGYAGLEFACGIPGPVGGAVIMNAGAWGGDIASVLRSVTLVTGDGEIHLASGDLEFSYRCWKGFATYQGRAVVAAVVMELTAGTAEAILAHCNTLNERRKATQPNEHHNAGSFFKNPPGDSAGRLIEASGLKGLRVGGAMVSERHGNFLVNTGGATAADVLQLMKTVQDRVKTDSSVCLEPEVHFIR